MKKITIYLLIAVLMFSKAPTILAEDITYEFSGVLVNYAISFTVEDATYNHGWLGEVIGDDNLLSVYYAEIEFTNEKNEVTNGECLITLKGSEGEYNFLSNSMCTDGGNGYRGNGLRIQFWAHKILDGTNVVKSFNKNEQEKIVYLAFENYQNGRPTTLKLSFNEPDVFDFVVLDEYPAKIIRFSEADSVGKPTIESSFQIADAMTENDTVVADAVVENNNSIASSKAKQTSADILYELDLFKGTDTGYELESALTRAQAATLIVRLLGKEAEVDNNPQANVFTDVPESHWAKNYIAYCYENNITYGTGNNTYSPEALIPFEQFSTLVLRTLGYSASPETAIEAAVDSGMLSANGANQLAEGTFTRGDTVVLMKKALKTTVNNKKSTLASALQKEGIINRTKALELNILPDLTSEGSLEVIGELVADKFE